MKNLIDELFRIDLQFFGDDGEDNNQNQGEDSKDGDQNPNNSGDNTNSNGENGKDETKTYTNAELQRMMAKEKKQGKSAGKTELMKELGIDNLDDFKSSLEDFKKYQESQKTEAEKANEKITKATNEKASAEKRAELAEAKVEAMKNGVNPQFVDDVITLALAKKQDGEDLSDVIESMKESHKMFFGTNTEDDGTGNNINGKKAPLKVDGIGATLGKKKAAANSVKSSYFKN